MVCLVELTIHFEARYEETHSLKENKYAGLVEKIRKAGIYSPKLITLEVDSRDPSMQLGLEISKPTNCFNKRMGNHACVHH